MQVEDDIGDLDDTQVTELDRKRYKEDTLAKDMITRCAEVSVSRATSELKAITSQLFQDAAERDQRLAERNAALAEKLTGLVKVVSKLVDSKISSLSSSMDRSTISPNQRTAKLTISNKWCKINGRYLRKKDVKMCNPMTKRL